MDDLRDRLVRKGNYIHGSFIKPESVDGYINCVNPGDRTDILGRFPFSEAAVGDAISHAERGFEELRGQGLNDRAALVRAFREQVYAYQEPVSRLLSRETGKPLWEARQEIVGAVRDIDLYLDEGLGLLAPRTLADTGARSDFVPRGVVAVLCPYTYPFRVAATRTAAAVLAGNSVVYKPSKFTPAVGQAVAEIWDRVRAPRGVVNMVQGSGSVVGQKLITHPGVSALLATCSFKTAMAVRRAVFERPELPVVYETGGKGVAIVLADADLDQAVYEVMVGAFLTAGQRHNSTARVLVEDGIYDRFVAELVVRTGRLEIGYGFRDNVFMGPLISENLRTRFRKYNRALAARGHKPLLKGKALNARTHRGFYVSPGIHAVDHDAGHPFLNEEPPGPNLLVYRVSDLAAAVALHNRAVYRLVCSLFTTRQGLDLQSAMHGLKTGAVNVNRSTVGATLRLPSTGLGRSAGGGPGGLELVRALTFSRSQVQETRDFDPRLTVPGTHWVDEGELEELSVELEG